MVAIIPVHKTHGMRKKASEDRTRLVVCR